MQLASTADGIYKGGIGYLRVLVTGGAGFIGSNLVDRLLADGHAVTVFDNFSTGRREFLEDARRRAVRIVVGDLLDPPALVSAAEGHDLVFHLAANADVRHGIDHPRRDLEQNTLGTHHVLEAVRINEIPRLCFASTGSVYGEPALYPTPEDCAFPVQTSLYGASKLAAEGLISAYCYGFGIRASVFRFVSILGPRYTHGHVFDFCKKLFANPETIQVLGNGKQRKSYLHVQDVVDAVNVAIAADAAAPYEVFNLGTDGYCTVDESLSWICTELGVNPEREYAGGERGWVGDSPLVHLDCQRMRQLGWRPKYTIRESVLETVRFLCANRWLLEDQK
jgi:UDP-glucose 4-epimerase